MRGSLHPSCRPRGTTPSAATSSRSRRGELSHSPKRRNTARGNAKKFPSQALLLALRYRRDLLVSSILKNRNNREVQVSSPVILKIKQFKKFEYCKQIKYDGMQLIMERIYFLNEQIKQDKSSFVRLHPTWFDGMLVVLEIYKAIYFERSK